MRRAQSIDRVRMRCAIERAEAEIAEHRAFRDRAQGAAGVLRSATATAGIPHHRARELAEELSE